MTDDATWSTPTIGLRDRVRYRFDNLLARGTWAVLLFLGAVTLVVLVVSALLLGLAGVTFSSNEGTSLFEGFWQSMLRAIDPGTMADDIGWGRRLLALLVTIFGILVAGTLIGLIASGVEQRVEAMQRGRSAVIESGHVVILGASPRLAAIVDQLTLAGRRRGGNAIVVLADREPRQLAEEVRSVVTDTRGSRLVFRCGDPARRSDLAIVRVDRAREVIVLADDDGEGDAAVVKVTLAVGAELGGFDKIPIVAELRDVQTSESLSAACLGQVHTMVPSQAVARMTGFALGEPGLNQVVEELTDFRGSDIYIRPLGDLVGSTFGQTVHRFTKVHPIGRMGAGGDVELNPAPHTELAEGDRLIVVADDYSESLELRESPRYEAPTSTRRIELSGQSWTGRMLIIGWNGLGPPFVERLEQGAAPGSSVEVIYDARLFSPDEFDVETSDRLTVTLTPTKSNIWRPPADDQLSGVNSIVFLGSRRGASTEAADSRTLLNVMTLSQELERRGGVRPRIVAELVNPQNVELARLAGADDFLVSDAVGSRLLAQLAEQPERRNVFLSLYALDRPSIHLVHAQEIGVVGELGWDEIIDRVYSHGLLAIGWRRTIAGGTEVHLNPAASDVVVLEADDQVVVIG